MRPLIGLSQGPVKEMVRKRAVRKKLEYRLRAHKLPEEKSKARVLPKVGV